MNLCRSLLIASIALVAASWSQPIVAQDAADGQLVVTTVNKRFIRFDLPHMTRYGKSKTLEVHPTIESESTFLLKFTAQ